MAMTFGEKQDKVRRLMDEATTAYFSDDDIALAINEGYAELADATEFYERFAYVPMLKKRTYYDLSLILPDTFLSPRRIYNPTTSRWLIPTDAKALDVEYQQWEMVDGEPDRYLLRGDRWLGVFPRPTKDSTGLRLYYSAIPAEMTDDNERPEYPEEFDDGPVQYAVSDLLGQRRETKKALAKWQKYLGIQEKLRLYVEGRQQLTQVRTL